MSDDNDNQRIRKPLGLKRSVDAGEVKQTFSHGRTNKVVVEVKRRRVLGKPGEAAPPPPPAPEPVVEAPRPAPPPPAPKPARPAPASETPQERVKRLQLEAEEERLRMAEEAGAQAVRLIHKPVAPTALLTEAGIENALRVLLALGGSTNALVHLAAIAGRAGVTIDYHRLNELSDTTPVLVDLKPTGEGYMEDFHAAGGMQALLWELRDLLNLDTPDLDGVTLRDRIGDGSHFVNRKIIRARENPISPEGGLIALRGSLAPEGAILKRSAATPSLFETEARCIVFDGLEDLANRIDDPDLDVTASDILVLKGAGPRSAAGMPEAGYLPIPKKLARAGVKDMVRISDCRMSGTAFGTIVLHVAPEAAVGGPLALARSGDRIRLSVKDRRLDLLVDEAEMAARRAAWTPAPAPARGWDRLVHEQVTQAPLGADLAFLRPPGC